MGLKLDWGKEFEEMYRKGYSDEKMSELSGRSIKAIQSMRKRRGLPINVRNYRNLVPSEVKEFVDKGLTDHQIALIYNVHTNSVKSFRRSRGWGKPANKGNLNPPIYLSQYEKEFLVGTMLGDAHLKCVDGKFYKGKIEHGPLQKRYCEWKYEKLKNISIPPVTYIRKDSGGNPTFFTFKSNPALKEFYDMFYSSGKKEVSEEVLKYISAESIALWFMDDGSRENKNPTFCTDSFSLESINRLIKFLKEKYNISSVLSSRNRIRICVESRELFFNLIKPYIHEDLMYKITQEKLKDFLVRKQQELLANNP